MGFNTSILISNDARLFIKDNPFEFTKCVLRMMDITGDVQLGDSLPIGGQSNVVSLITRAHADTTNLVLIGQNSSETLYQTGIWHGEEQKNIDILKKAAFNLGYNLVKRRS